MNKERGNTMEDLLNGGVEELQAMINDLGNRDVCMNQVNVCANEGKKLEKELKQETDNLNKDLNDTVNEERNKAIAEEDKIIADAGKRLRDIKNERNKAKDREIKERIDNETSGFIEENRDLHRIIRKSFKEEGLPAFCDTKWFYTIYCPQGGMEWLIKILIFLAGLVIIPGIFVAIVDPWWFVKIILWVIIAVIFIGIYLTIYLISKDKDTGILEDMRLSRYKILDNEKQIKKIRSSIKNDTDESHYNLDEFDNKITETQQMIDEATKTREMKLKDFEENKKQQVIEVVNNNHNPIIAAKKEEISKKAEEYQAAVDKSNETVEMITNKYETVFTKQYSTKAAAQKMLELIQNGQAQNIGEALQILKQ